MPLEKKIVGVGGLGGSGTRLLAEALLIAGFEMGVRLNKSLDDLWFTALFKRENSYLPRQTDEITQRWNWYAALREGNRISFLDRLRIQQYMKANGDPRIYPDPPLDTLWKSNAGPALWGWKEPNTHLFAKQLLDEQPHLHYVHMIRDGRYMVHSANQQQFNTWNHLFDIPVNVSKERQRLLFWLQANESIFQCMDFYPDRIHIIHYEELVAHPLLALSKLWEALEIKQDVQMVVDQLHFHPIKQNNCLLALSQEEKERLAALGYPE